MFGLPKSTEINKPLPKKVVFDTFNLKPADRRLFDEQINRMTIVAEISPQTVNVSATDDISAVFVILITLKVPECDKKNIVLLSKLIDQRMIFALHYEDSVRFAVYRAGRVLMSGNKPLGDWDIALSGLNLETVWENIIAGIGGINLADGKDLDEAIATNERRDKLTRQIAALEQKAMNEQQPRRKWEGVEEIKRLKAELEGMR